MDRERGQGIGRGRRVLIINAYDEGEMYADALRCHGFAVTIATTAGHGLKLFQQLKPEIVVQGIAFADLSGTELVKRLRAGSAGRSIPLIVVSGFTDEAFLESIYRTGCDLVLLKPCLPEDLLDRIQLLLRSKMSPLPATSRSRARKLSTKSHRQTRRHSRQRH